MHSAEYVRSNCTSATAEIETNRLQRTLSLVLALGQCEKSKTYCSEASHHIFERNYNHELLRRRQRNDAVMWLRVRESNRNITGLVCSVMCEMRRKTTTLCTCACVRDMWMEGESVCCGGKVILKDRPIISGNWIRCKAYEKAFIIRSFFSLSLCVKSIAIKWNDLNTHTHALVTVELA